MALVRKLGIVSPDDLGGACVYRCCKQLAAGVGVLSLALAAAPAHARWTVFDPSSFSQNVLTAARTLQQINNQITSLQNEAQGLINQAPGAGR